MEEVTICGCYQAFESSSLTCPHLSLCACPGHCGWSAEEDFLQGAKRLRFQSLLSDLVFDCSEPLKLSGPQVPMCKVDALSKEMVKV